MAQSEATLVADKRPQYQVRRRKTTYQDKDKTDVAVDTTPRDVEIRHAHYTKRYRKSEEPFVITDADEEKVMLASGEFERYQAPPKSGTKSPTPEVKEAEIKTQQ